jgi:3-deoxy-D-manno-octulosonic-acid transferase
MFVMACLYLPWRLIVSPKYAHNLRERFGFIHIDKQEQGAIWIQAVSVGETMAARPLIDALRRDYPHTPLVLSNTTLTGAVRSSQLYPDLTRIFFPWDFKHVARRTLRRMRPRVLMLMETEIWPCLIAECARENIPVLLLNARMSARSMRNYMRFKPFIAQVLGQLPMVAAQNTRSARRFEMLGARPDRISMCGNLKFDSGLSKARQTRAAVLRQRYRGRLIWVAGSTHTGEELIVLKAASMLWEQFPDMLLVLAPRHPERFKEVAALCAAQGHDVMLHSVANSGHLGSRLLMLDEMGLLEDYLAAADVAFIGGSLSSVGGHNMFEAAIYGVPVVCGPHLFNFEEAAKILLNCGSMLLVEDAQTLAARVGYWLANKPERKRAGRAGADAASRQRGALSRHMHVIRPFLEGVAPIS